MPLRSRTLVPTALALALAALFLLPLAASAQVSSAKISMYPTAAGPGSTVEVTGIDFPPGRVVEVQLKTPDGTQPLTTATATEEGTFRQVVSLPLTATEGAWELQANAADGTGAWFSFTTMPDAAIDTIVAIENASSARAGNTSGDIALMLFVAVALGGVAFGAMLVYRQMKDETPPGMGSGDDLIWGGGPGEAEHEPEPTATDEPHWKAAEVSQAES